MSEVWLDIRGYMCVIVDTVRGIAVTVVVACYVSTHMSRRSSGKEVGGRWGGRARDACTCVLPVRV